MDLKAHIISALFRALRLGDAPGILEHLRFQDLRRRYYDLFWNRAAAEVKADIVKWEGGFHRLTRNGTMAIVRGPELRLDDHLTLDLMGNKALTYELMAEQGVSVPRHVRFSVTDLTGARTFLAAAGRPLVVKPNGGTGGGRGVTTGITSPAQLRRASFWAARFDTGLLAEEQIEGHSFRLLFLDGRFLDAIRRDPPQIIGDGRGTIQDLVTAENRRRLTGRPFTALSPLRLDADALNYLSAQTLSPRSVPANGETVIIKRACNENNASGNHVVTGSVHSGTIATCARLARNLGVRLAGIDIIAHDISLPLSPANGLIGEINTTPGLHHHDLIATPRLGPSAAALILNHMFETGAGTVALAAPDASPAALRMAAA